MEWNVMFKVDKSYTREISKHYLKIDDRLGDCLDVESIHKALGTVQGV